MNPTDWHFVENLEDVPSPGLLIFRDRAEENVRRMIAMAGNPARLRPHIKTHKLPELVKMQMDAGVTRFKCATVAEAEVAAEAGASEVLLAFQPIGPAPRRLRQLADTFPRTQFGAVVDDAGPVRELGAAFRGAAASLDVYLDLDCGMHRTGIQPGSLALELVRFITSLSGLRWAGLHAYDGHIHDADPEVRRAKCLDAFQAVRDFQTALRDTGLAAPVAIAGGTPTFPIHAQDPTLELSPGTCVLWDFGYGDKFLDMPFLIAALVLCRVVSKPSADRLCLDLGHKAVAAENPQPRVRLIGLEDAVPVMHSEEHLVIETPRAGDYRISDVVLAIPRHVCPTVALHSEAYVVSGHRVVDRWAVRGRARVLSV